jgi:hypothetical protein
VPGTYSVLNLEGCQFIDCRGMPSSRHIAHYFYKIHFDASAKCFCLGVTVACMPLRARVVVPEPEELLVANYPTPGKSLPRANSGVGFATGRVVMGSTARSAA